MVYYFLLFCIFDKISLFKKKDLLAEPIYIPAPEPIVIPAPNMITLHANDMDDNRSDLPDEITKSKVTYYPSISNDQADLNNFGIRQISNLNLKFFF